MEDKELKNCPFCGSDYAFLEIIKCATRGSDEVYAVWCCECGARSGRAATKEEAKEAWNQRNEE